MTGFVITVDLPPPGERKPLMPATFECDRCGKTFDRTYSKPFYLIASWEGVRCPQPCDGRAWPREAPDGR